MAASLWTIRLGGSLELFWSCWTITDLTVVRLNGCFRSPARSPIAPGSGLMGMGDREPVAYARAPAHRCPSGHGGEEGQSTRG
jgi:hypothetical protein